jgi:outer membrane protein assembly complex protein YaeT
MIASDRLISPVRRCALAVAGVLFHAALALAQPATTGKVLVEDVIPQGNRVVPTQKIMSLIKTRPGSEYQQDTLDEDVKKLYESKLFANIKVEVQPLPNNRVKVFFVIAELQNTIQEIIYIGNHHMKPDELDTITGLRRGQPLNPIANKIAQQAILRHYTDEGRLWASVDVLEGNNQGDTRVVFNITEGPKVRISSIGFEGNHFVSAGRLRTQIDSMGRILVFGGTFDKEQLDRDVNHLLEYYRGFGFRDVRVTRELQWGEKPGEVRVVFHINEGLRYRITDIHIDGNKLISTDALQSKIKLVSGEYYSKSKAEADKTIIEAMYGYRGYPTVVREQDFYSGTPGQMAVHYEVIEKPPAKVSSIIIVGNDVTKENVIRRQLGAILPGQTLPYPDLKVAERNLASLQIFQVKPEQGIRPTVSVIDPDVESEFKDILVTVQEDRTGSLIFGVGVNSDMGLIGSIALNEHNFDIAHWPTSIDDLLSGHAFRGAGQELRIEAVPGTQLQRYSVSWREPSLFDSLYSLQVSGYYTENIFNEYTESRLGTRWTLARRLNRYWTVSGGIRLEDVGVHDVQPWEPEQILVDEGQHFLLGLRGGVTYNSTDSYLRPTEGLKADLAFEEFLGDYTFPKVDLNVDKFFTLYQRADNSGKQVLVAHSELAVTGSHTPVFERFYAGGFSSMRGFEFRGVGPFVNGYNVGGDFKWINSLEYQIPFLANDRLYGVVFCDSGTVEQSVELRDYRVSAGFGLRIQIPGMGPVPIALDFGFPIVKAPGDREQVFSFWVGFFH